MRQNNWKPIVNLDMCVYIRSIRINFYPVWLFPSLTHSFTLPQQYIHWNFTTSCCFGKVRQKVVLVLSMQLLTVGSLRRQWSGSDICLRVSLSSSGSPPKSKSFISVRLFTFFLLGPFLLFMPTSSASETLFFSNTKYLVFLHAGVNVWWPS